MTTTPSGSGGWGDEPPGDGGWSREVPPPPYTPPPGAPPPWQQPPPYPPEGWTGAPPPFPPGGYPPGGYGAPPWTPPGQQWGWGSPAGPQGPAGLPPLAGWLRRAGGALLDALIFVVLDLVVDIGGFHSGAVSLSSYLLLAGCQILYTVALTATWGQTLGMRAVGVRLRNEADGSTTVSLGTCVTRALVAVAIGILPLVGSIAELVNYLSPLWDRRNQTWHDHVAHTVVTVG